MKTDPTSTPTTLAEEKIPTLPASKVEDSASLLVKLEAETARKARNLRIDTQAHIQSGPHLKAEKFRQYTEWLTQHTNRKSKFKPNLKSKLISKAASNRPPTASVPAQIRAQSNSQSPLPTTPADKAGSETKQTPPASSVSYVTATSSSIEELTKYANPDILVTIDNGNLSLPVDENRAKEVKADSVEQRLVWRHDISIPIDSSKLSVEGLTRIDGAHSTQSVIKPKTRNRKLTSKTKSEANAKPSPESTDKLQIGSTSTKEIPTSIVTWEVNDFYWPEMIQSLNESQAAAAQAMANAVTNILSATEQRLGITGSGRGPGTTTISMYLARALAQRNKKVLLVDADLSKPDLTCQLGLPDDVNWLNAVKGTGLIADTIVRSNETGICLMPVQKLATRVAWPRFLFDCLGELVDEIRFEFDYVLVDLGPASQIVRELSRPHLLVDAAMLVHNVRVPDRSTLARNQQELNAFGMKRLVVAENFALGSNQSI